MKVTTLVLLALLPVLLPARPQPEAGVAHADQEIAALESRLSHLYNHQDKGARGQGYRPSWSYNDPATEA